MSSTTHSRHPLIQALGLYLFGLLSCGVTLILLPILFLSWMAPESYFDGVWDLRSDVWMFGVFLWGMLVD